MGKNTGILFTTMRILFMTAILGYVLYQFIFFPAISPLFPNAYDLCPYAITDSLGRFLMENSLSLPVHFSGVISLFVILTVLTFLFGRVFCGNICPLGTLQETIGYLGRWIYKKILKRNRPELPPLADTALKYIKYIYLITSLFITWYFCTLLIGFTSENAAEIRPFQFFYPWGAVQYISLPELFSAAMSIAVISLILTLAASFFFERAYCKYLCPAGALYAIINRFSLTKPVVSQHACRGLCPMNLQPNKNNKITSGECISCYKCLRSDSNSGLFLIKPRINPLVVMISFTLIFLGSVTFLREAGVLTEELYHVQTVKDICEIDEITLEEYRNKYSLPESINEKSAIDDVVDYLNSLSVKEHFEAVYPDSGKKQINAIINEFLTAFNIKDFDTSLSFREALNEATVEDVLVHYYGENLNDEGSDAFREFILRYNLPEDVTRSDKFGTIADAVDLAITRHNIESDFLPCCYNEDFYPESYEFD